VIKNSILVTKLYVMPTKVSERKLLTSIVLFTIASTFLFSAKLFNGTVKISEKGIAFIVIGITAAAIAVSYFRKAVEKV
jgi:uncharacterized membrane protein YiaA